MILFWIPFIRTLCISHTLTLINFPTHIHKYIVTYSAHAQDASSQPNARTNTHPCVGIHACAHRHIHVHLSSTYAVIRVVGWVCELSSSLKSKVPSGLNEGHIFLSDYHMILKNASYMPCLEHGS
jgi:hypothetical protein